MRPSSSASVAPFDARAQALIAQSLTCPAHGFFKDRCLRCLMDQAHDDERSYRIVTLGSFGGVTDVRRAILRAFVEHGLTVNGTGRGR